METTYYVIGTDRYTAYVENIHNNYDLCIYVCIYYVYVYVYVWDEY